MSEWFTVEKIDSQTFAISEYKHWEETHCYLLCGEESAVLIDTGLGVSNIREIVDNLTKLPVMVVTTHIHWDHIGGHKYFDNIAVHEKEKNWLSVRFPIPMQVVKDNLTKIPCNFPPEFDINAYQIFQGRKYLYSGDLVYKGCLYAFYPTTDPQLFYQSVKQVQKFKIERIMPGHHKLNIPVSLINTIEAGFAQLERNGQLKQGNGLFEFGEFQIQI